MDESSLQLVTEIGDQLSRTIRPNKDILVKSLRQIANALSQIEQPSSAQDEKKTKAALEPLRNCVVKLKLVRHSDKDVKLLVAICVCELFRILAPETPFEDKYLRDVFKLILGVFSELGDTASLYFSRRVKILETVASCKCCVIMLDINCFDLVLEMFNVFFTVVRENHQQNLINDLLSIMTDILNEEASQQLVNVIMQNLIKEGKDAPSAASQLAVSIIQTCADKLEPFVCGFLTSCSLDRDSVENKLKESYHEIMVKIFQCSPDMLCATIPCLTQELTTDQVDVRIKAVNVVGKIFALPEHHAAQKYRNLFVEFKNRFSDKSVEVRLTAVKCAKACYMANPFGKESCEILAALEGRLLDFDDKVRTQAVIITCDLARSNFRYFPPEMILKVTDRLRDKKVSVRKVALQKLIKIYQDYCTKYYKDHATCNDSFEQIPCKVLMLCFDKDCKEFRPQNMEIVLAEDMFPDVLSLEEMTRHWVHIFSLFTPLHVKALNSILTQKRRLRTEMKLYLSLRKNEKSDCFEEMQKKMKSSFTKMSASFPDPSQAEEWFHKLNQMKDNNIFSSLDLLLDEESFCNARKTRDKFLKMIGDKHPYFEFFRLLSSKCSVSIFGSEHVHCILDDLLSKSIANDHAKSFYVKLLLTIISNFPSLLRGSEEKLQLLLEESPIEDILIEILAKGGSHISVKFRNFYPFLKKMCLEGTRVQSKHAVSAIASLSNSTNQSIYQKLCKDLVNSLHRGLNVPTVLQSLGCIAQHSISAFQSHYEEIRSFICDKIFLVEEHCDPAIRDDSSECGDPCKLKIYGLKVLVKSFLPHQGSHVQWKIDDLLEILSSMLQTGDTSGGTMLCHKTHIRLAAAKSVLRLSRRWDLHISPDVFRYTISIAKDPTPFVRKAFLDKIHKLFKECALPCRYSCAFAQACYLPPMDLQDASRKYMEEFINDQIKKVRSRQTSAIKEGSYTDCPAYMVVYFIHILAHDSEFPSDYCQDEELYSQFCSPLFWVIQALLCATTVNDDMDTISCLLGIFRAIKRAEDAVDAQKTSKLQVLAEIGLSIVNALTQLNISSFRAPALILLPSSLYKISIVKQCDKANLKSLILLPNQDFIQRVVNIIKSQKSEPANTLSKCDRKAQKDLLQSEKSKSSLPNQASHGHAELSIVRTTEVQRTAQQEANLRPGRKRALSPSDLESGLHEDSCNEGSKNHASKISKPFRKKEQCSSSCDSASERPVSEPQVSMQEVEISAPLLRRNPKKSNRAAAESSKGQKANTGNPCKISSDCRDVELLCLDSESEEIISHSSLEEKDNSLIWGSNMLSSHRDPWQCSSLTSRRATVDSLGGCATKELLIYEEDQKSCDGAETFLGRVKKGDGVCLDTSMSEITNVKKDIAVRRSLRQKA